MRRLFTILLLISVQWAMAQEDSLRNSIKPDAFKVIEMEHKQTRNIKSSKTNFEHWMYSQKKHAAVGYMGSIAQSGFSNGESTYTWHYDLGAIYRGYLVDKKGYKLNLHAWVEHTNLLAGSNPKQFAKDINMFSVPNASDAEGAGFSLEYLHMENFFFDGFLDVTVGKMEPTFYMTFANFSGWDKLTFFNKTSASDPVPDMDGAFGFFTELNFSDYFSIGAQIIDDNPGNEYLDPLNFFQNTTYAYQGFIRWAIPSRKNLYSYHMLDFYSYEKSAEKSAGNGWIYVGNQGVSERLILTIKLSHGSGRVFKYNGAYAAGVVYLNPFTQAGDQIGASIMVNELNKQFEYGLDTYYKFFVQDWFTASVNMQTYFTKSEKAAVIPGVRVMITY